MVAGPASLTMHNRVAGTSRGVDFVYFSPLLTCERQLGRVCVHAQAQPELISSLIPFAIHLCCALVPRGSGHDVDPVVPSRIMSSLFHFIVVMTQILARRVDLTLVTASREQGAGENVRIAVYRIVQKRTSLHRASSSAWTASFCPREGILAFRVAAPFHAI